KFQRETPYAANVAMISENTVATVQTTSELTKYLPSGTVDHMTERIRIARTMITEPSSGSACCADRFDIAWVRDCKTEGGVFVELGSWWLRRNGAAVSADWLLSQHAVLDA
ncbi:hypothetical protein IAE22_33080, partial [Bacillus sp. S34]|nr:hypothetical protein [Bacillus sp. S34]